MALWNNRFWKVWTQTYIWSKRRKLRGVTKENGSRNKAMWVWQVVHKKKRVSGFSSYRTADRSATASFWAGFICQDLGLGFELNKGLFFIYVILLKYICTHTFIFLKFYMSNQIGSGRITGSERIMKLLILASHKSFWKYTKSIAKTTSNIL